jgi:hypothetical protein
MTEQDRQREEKIKEIRHLEWCRDMDAYLASIRLKHFHKLGVHHEIVKAEHDLITNKILASKYSKAAEILQTI